MVGATAALRERDAEFSLSWCNARYLPPQLAVACNIGGNSAGNSENHVVKIFRQSSGTGADAAGAMRSWRACETLTGHSDTIHDVAWAPSIGRSYQLVATACKDQHVRIFKLTPETSLSSVPAAAAKGFRVDLIADLTDHDSEVGDKNSCIRYHVCIPPTGLASKLEYSWHGALFIR